MAYPNYFPQFYQPNSYPMQMNATSAQSPQQIQNGGFVVARSENEVINYPIAPGNCVTFKIEGQPIVMEKSMGFSQLETPHIKRFRLVEEEVAQQIEQPKQESVDSINIMKDEIKSLWEELDKTKSMIEEVKNIIPKRNTAKRDKDGED